MGSPMVGSERLEVVRVREKFGPEVLLKVKEFRGETFLCIPKSALLDVLQFLKEDPELDYSYISECVGVDYSTWTHDRDLEGRFEVVYNLMSLKHSSRIFVKVAVNDGEPIPTAKGIFLGAEYPEREIQDLYGIPFEGNAEEPGMRFLLPDDWVGFPLRKEYPLGGEDVLFAEGTYGPAVEDVSMPHAGESFEGKTGSEDVSGR
ncbi:MAG TPA: NADH-quinone oxidoreductase subunit C [Fimbriimonadaceae bacterium]|nr:NADH-quinone oxidoreductase subunit C [Fimbriimonadaceae bacterium]HRJ32159.1 NADH-quinone oxidoreductase subunit C [Fimbriimonadaceae bacterium]